MRRKVPLITMGAIAILGLMGWWHDSYAASTVRIMVHPSRGSVPADGSTPVLFTVRVTNMAGRPLAHQLMDCVPQFGSVRTYLRFTNKDGEVVFRYIPPLANSASPAKNDPIEFLDTSVSTFIEVPAVGNYLMHETTPTASSGKQITSSNYFG